jgi:hypothetical protein
MILPLALLQFLELTYMKLDFSQVVHLASRLLLPVSCMAYSSVLKMETIGSSETSSSLSTTWLSTRNTVFLKRIGDLFTS